jgi:predicted alpha/beta-fold hydrolase
MIELPDYGKSKSRIQSLMKVSTRGPLFHFLKLILDCPRAILIYIASTKTVDLAYTGRPFYFFNRHIETIIPSAFFKVPQIRAERERLELSDGDFVDLDWYRQGSQKLVILSHGMEGSADRYYIKRSALYFSQREWDVLAWNNRGCSGEFNRKVFLNHHGEYRDLEEVANRALEDDYLEVYFIGFSMGGNQLSKLFAESSLVSDQRVKGGIGFSVTFDMAEMMHEFRRISNAIYRNQFLRKLKQRVRKLSDMHPRSVHLDGLEEVDSFEKFHEKYTTPIGSFKDVNDFYWHASPSRFLKKLIKPMLIINAQNDPFLGPSQHPEELAHRMENFFYLSPKYGGHLGFNYINKPYSYMEIASEAFFSEIAS